MVKLKERWSYEQDKGWVFFTWGVNEFIIFGGLILGLGLLVVSEAILMTILFFKRTNTSG